jgi:hypothetical protein
MVPGSGAWFLFSAEIATYPGQVSWLRSGNVLPVPSLLLPQLDGRVDVWRLIFVYSGGTAPGLHRTSLFSPRGHLGSYTIVSRRPVTQPQVTLTGSCVRAPVAFGQPTEEESQCAPKQQLHLPGRDPEFPEQTRGKGLWYFINRGQKARKGDR